MAGRPVQPGSAGGTGRLASDPGRVAEGATRQEGEKPMSPLLAMRLIAALERAAGSPEVPSLALLKAMWFAAQQKAHGASWEAIARALGRGRPEGREAPGREPGRTLGEAHSGRRHR